MMSESVKTDYMINNIPQKVGKPPFWKLRNQPFIAIRPFPHNSRMVAIGEDVPWKQSAIDKTRRKYELYPPYIGPKDHPWTRYMIYAYQQMKKNKGNPVPSEPSKHMKAIDVEEKNPIMEHSVKNPYNVKDTPEKPELSLGHPLAEKIKAPKAEKMEVFDPMAENEEKKKELQKQFNQDPNDNVDAHTNNPNPLPVVKEQTIQQTPPIVPEQFKKRPNQTKKTKKTKNKKGGK